jgi:hypothetical protein
MIPANSPGSHGSHNRRHSYSLLASSQAHSLSPWGSILCTSTPSRPNALVSVSVPLPGPSLAPHQCAYGEDHADSQFLSVNTRPEEWLNPLFSGLTAVLVQGFMAHRIIFFILILGFLVSLGVALVAPIYLSVSPPFPNPSISRSHCKVKQRV